MRYHVLLQERRLGPYDRRTIVGMRVKKALDSDDLLEASDGARLTVAELVNGGTPEPGYAEASFPGLPSGGTTHSVVQAMHAADLLGVEGRGYAMPPFKGEVELRVQTRVLRLAGRLREGLAWKEDRVKFPLQDVIHARLHGSVVELGVRAPDGLGLQRLRLDLRTRDAAGELVESLPHTVPWPGSEPLAGRSRQRGAGQPLAWGAVAAAVVAVAAILLWVALHRA
jgi:hypothetical protein